MSWKYIRPGSGILHNIINVEPGVDIYQINADRAEKIQRQLINNGVVSINVMGAVGSGKTLIIEKLVDILKSRGTRCGVIAGDVSGKDDFLRFSAHHVPVVNVNTGKECHLDTHLIEHALKEFDLNELDIIFIENVGNLICPADFTLGSQKKVVIISVTEGDDMVRKHPVIFGVSDIIVINKIDLSTAVDVDPEVIIGDAKKVAPHTVVLKTNAKKGTGLEELLDALGL